MVIVYLTVVVFLSFKILLQVLHNAFPRFAERGQMGGYQQQDANECWVELMGMLKQKLRPSSGENDRYRFSFKIFSRQEPQGQ